MFVFVSRVLVVAAPSLEHVNKTVRHVVSAGYTEREVHQTRGQNAGHHRASRHF